jgi:hypothetical protein
MNEIKLVAQTIQVPPKPLIPESSSPANAALGFDVTIMCFLGFTAALGTAIWTMKKQAKDLPISQSESPEDNIPCRNCQYFNRSHYLKCAVNPSAALTKNAIGCSDYCPTKKL